MSNPDAFWARRGLKLTCLVRADANTVRTLARVEVRLVVRLVIGRALVAKLLLLVELLLLSAGCWVLLCARSDVDVLFREDSYHARRDFVVGDHFGIFADDVNAESL